MNAFESFAAFKRLATLVNGQNAIFTYNGLTTERASNKFEINGFEVTLKAATQKDISFSSTPDTESILGTVTKFVDDYNKLIEDLQQANP